MSLFEQVKEVVVEQLGVKPDEVRPETSLVNDLGVDSLDAVELILALEEEFGIEIPDADAEAMATIDDMVKFIEKKIKG